MDALVWGYSMSTAGSLEILTNPDHGGKNRIGGQHDGVIAISVALGSATECSGAIGEMAPELRFGKGQGAERVSHMGV
ncbi:hypothetical protein [Mycolicibacterium helvum]|uniref:hypothetical protein n=1 Tax=Mycolicibacterium helvum TaxID=1534349 RepID=UPI0031EE73BB